MCSRADQTGSATLLTRSWAKGYGVAAYLNMDIHFFVLRNLPEHFSFEVSNLLSCLVPGGQKTEKLELGET